jgi:hypothetical protein
MEITYTREVSYSMDLDQRKTRELADHLDITVKDLRKLVERDELMDEHEAGLNEFMALNDKLEQQTEHGDREIETITW